MFYFDIEDEDITEFIVGWALEYNDYNYYNIDINNPDNERDYIFINL